MAYTTHVRAGVIRRNDVPNSDQATMTSYFIRYDLLTLLVLVEDPESDWGAHQAIRVQSAAKRQGEDVPSALAGASFPPAAAPTSGCLSSLSPAS